MLGKGEVLFQPGEQSTSCNAGKLAVAPDEVGREKQSSLLRRSSSARVVRARKVGRARGV